jgi:predicted  nucleic acid-binding Zn-ribbon protein
MSEKISKISVDGVIYDIASTGGGEVPGDIQEQLSALENKVTEEASTREEGDAKLSEKIESEASRVDGMVNQINENVASSIETLNNNLVQAIETINGGVAAEVTNREEGDAKLQAAIDELAEKVNGEDADFTELEEKIKKNAADIATVNNNLVEAVNNINKNVADGFSTINGGLNNEIRPELEKAVKYEDTATEQNPGRKTIFLNNHDNICGKTTDGSAVNIAMVSKWNKVDLGSSSVEINLNGSAERPTYNDSKQIALLEDVHGNMETIALVKKDDLTYELQVGDKIAGTINIPADQFLKSVEYSAEDKSLTFVFNTSEGEQTSVVDLSSLVDTYVAGNGIELIENGFSIKLDPSSESYLSVSEAGIKVEGINEIKKNVQEVAANLVTVNENLASSIDAINKKAVKYEDVADSNLPERKAIVLKNGDVILGGNLEGGTSSLVQLNRWGVADFGSSSVPFNINTPKDVRPTVQEAGQLGEEAHKIAYLEDVAGLSNTLEALNATVQILQSKVDVLTKTNTEVVSVDGSAGELKDSSKDYIVSGSINENAEIVGKSISLKSIKVSDNARLKLNAGDVEAKDLNISGSFPKANGNTVISVNNAEFIVFKDMVFDASEVYNGIEIGLASNSVLPKNILFDNCKFQGEFSNNAILVFGTQDNAIITLNNCYFEKISNALRLSNKSNASGVVVNINNCTVDQWETRAPWQGFLICEDYTNKTEEEVNANNLFGDGKITVNFNNLVHAGVKINPADPASVCGTKNESQVVMVCQDAVAGPEGDYCLSYDAAKFPVVSFK